MRKIIIPISKTASLFALSAALVAFNSANAAPIINNGGFEQGLSGWSMTAPSGCAGAIPAGISGSGAFQSGRCESSLSQAINTTAGATYQLVFWAKDVRPSGSSSIIVRINGVEIALVEKVGKDWAEFRFEWVAGENDQLQFDLEQRRNGGSWLLDDIRVEKIKDAAVSAPGTLLLLTMSLGLFGFRRLSI